MTDCLDAGLAAGFVNDAIAGERRVEVESHLVECAMCRRLVAELARIDSDEDLDGDDATIGRYQIRGVRGRGGMGIVYDAYDPKLDRPIAIKVVRPGVESAESHARLLREGHALAKLAHPNVLAVFDVGELGDEIYIALELVEGLTLREWLRSDRTPAEILETFCDAARGLAAAHDCGMVHRDFKPDNVLVGDDGRVRVADFGLVSATGATAPGATARDGNGGLGPTTDSPTKTGTLLGTPAYMAPEQRRGGLIDGRADQYSFAVTLREALTGDRDGPLDRIEGRVRRALLRALADDPADRFDQMGDLIAAIAPRPRRRTAVIAASAALALVAGGIGVLVLSGTPESPCEGSTALFAPVWNAEVEARAHANVEASGHRAGGDAFERIRDQMRRYRDVWSDFHRQACRATHVDKAQTEVRFRKQLVCLFDRLARARVLAGRLDSSLTAREVDELVASTRRLPPIDGCERVDNQLASLLPDAGQRAEVEAIRASISGAFAELDLAARGETLEHAGEIKDRADASGFVPVRAEALQLVGRVHLERGDPDRAEPVLREAVTLAARANHDELLARLWVDITEALFERGKYAEAIANAPVVEAAIVRAGGDARLRARGIQIVGEAYWWKPDYAKALAAMREATALIESSYGASDPDLPMALANTAEALIDWDDYAGALPVARRAVTLAEAAYGRDHSISSWAGFILGMALRVNKADAEALAVLTDARERVVALTDDHPDLAWVDRELGHLHARAGDLETAVAAHRRAAERSVGAHGPRDYRVSLHLKNIAAVERKRGRIDAARAALAEALAIRLASRGAEHPTTGEIHRRLGDLEYDAGDREAAARHLDKAEAIYRGVTSELSREGAARVLAVRARMLYADPKTRTEGQKLAREAFAELGAVGADTSELEPLLAERPD